MPEKVFANTSVIQYLHCLGLISILKKLFGEIYIPLEVKEELDNGIIKAIKPYLDKLSDIGFYLSKEHRNLILKKADEAD